MVTNHGIDPFEDFPVPKLTEEQERAFELLADDARWIAANQERLMSTCHEDWIGVSNKQVIASADSQAEVRAKLKAQGVDSQWACVMNLRPKIRHIVTGV